MGADRFSFPFSLFMDVTEVSVIDRGRRYRADDPFTTKRTHRVWSGGVGDTDLNPAQAARRVVDKMDDVILAYLLGIGEPRHIGDRPVHPPYEDGQQAALQRCSEIHIGCVINLSR
ncbi:hypothetical protein Rru_A0850 [Rhodospirillum rubrum ATCC 11170]|uniref:Uncharacterized protein n=1 Tax=Rhodospirillum rubrum (strain ATCC 11170 / ATH 1.1.1 / DSM 467 / LMG 4362 / NCIMB 8255 / S1) TaxID=269796 RepID=Q2RW44_RHORT|nr:hypothetical protein [Rhodospirillum rubrum]ABC21651.1 hypothetical protein Rru_A0850 [Rhodospirillum rubrum ATCC 11170]MBK5953202.1 hypothetical protein [Rhodospirillum rubrum]